MKRSVRQTTSGKKPREKQKKGHKKFEAKKPKTPLFSTSCMIGKASGEKRKTMTYKEKVEYYDIATEKRAEFERAMAEYNKRMYEETDEESEFDG